MSQQDDSTGTSWGVQLNLGYKNSGRNRPEWANRLQREKFDKTGVIIWNNASKQVARLSALHVLRIYEELLLNNELMRSGIVVGEPAMRISIDDPDHKSERVLTDQIELNDYQTHHLFKLIEQNLQTLKEMAESEKEEERKILARVYEFILNVGKATSDDNDAA